MVCGDARALLPSLALCLFKRCLAGFVHSAFTFSHECLIARNRSLAKTSLPPGALIAVLSKGLQFSRIEAHLDEVWPAARGLCMRRLRVDRAYSVDIRSIFWFQFLRFIQFYHRFEFDARHGCELQLQVTPSARLGDWRPLLLWAFPGPFGDAALNICKLRVLASLVFV